MKINPDTILKLIEAVKVLESLPFWVNVSTICKDMDGTDVLILDREIFADTFPECEEQYTGTSTIYIAKKDGVNFRCCEMSREGRAVSAGCKGGELKWQK